MLGSHFHFRTEVACSTFSCHVLLLVPILHKVFTIFFFLIKIKIILNARDKVISFPVLQNLLCLMEVWVLLSFSNKWVQCKYKANQTLVASGEIYHVCWVSWSFPKLMILGHLACKLECPHLDGCSRKARARSLYLSWNQMLVSFPVQDKVLCHQQVNQHWFSTAFMCRKISSLQTNSEKVLLFFYTLMSGGEGGV